MFAFSGADGPTNEGSGFVGLLLPELYAVQFSSGDATIHLGLGPGDNGSLAVASSDVIVVNGKASSDPAVVLAYSAWDLMVGYSPYSRLDADFGSDAGCNITGQWSKGGGSDDDSDYDLEEELSEVAEFWSESAESWSDELWRLS